MIKMTPPDGSCARLDLCRRVLRLRPRPRASRAPGRRSPDN